MKNKVYVLWFFFATFCPISATFAQTEAQKRQAALTVKEALGDFQSSLGSLFGSAPKDQDIVQRRRNIDVVNGYAAANFRILNDLFKGSSTLDWLEFVKRVPLEFPNGLLFEIELRKASFNNSIRNTQNGYLIEVYAKKSVSGVRRNGEYVELSNKPCRIGVYLNALGNSRAGCKIAFIDEDMTGLKNSFILDDGTSPLDYKTLNETLANIAAQVNAEIKKQGLQKVQLTAFTYEQQGVVDEFSLKTTTAFQAELLRLNPTLQITSPSRSLQEETKIKGSYQVKGNFVEFFALLESADQRILSEPASDRLLPKNIDPNAINPPSIAPAIIQDVKNVKAELNKVSVPSANANTLQFFLATNRGMNSLVYERNDTMRVAVRANKPCYVRLVYRMADEQMVLLRDSDFKIDEYELNQWIEIPQDFICWEPFGAEFLLAYASTEAFDGLQTKDVDGYKIILNPLAEIKKISTARAFKNAGVSVVERQLQITTKEARK
ncbi:MAG: hypothetical protein ACK4UP_12705 [Spirosomataceae bacterium]